MEREPSAELLWSISLINTFCDEANKDHPCNAKNYIDKIKELCFTIDNNFELNAYGNNVIRK